ncbi:hypothetical protein PENTCL1PPCAC_20814, partial [Pristionchus entomophagus]
MFIQYLALSIVPCARSRRLVDVSIDRLCSVGSDLRLLSNLLSVSRDYCPSVDMGRIQKIKN